MGFGLIQLISLLFLLVLYHFAEYIIHKIIHPKETDTRSFLITREYLIAFSVGIIEFLVGNIFFSHTKTNPNNPIIWIGLIFILIGLFIRFSAILTARKSFTHELADFKKKEHILITWGIYKYIRHPGYLGFLVFAVGTQIFLCNVISTIGFAAVLWYFFDRRIRYEERTLIEFFGNDYIEYRKKTPTLIPFIK